ncbi:biotin--[acetyl-CoA-carboxylase] ligase [Corynebacterium sphenisci]|uniref:biotin--[acetyl-CoA-carboxylase] ligase n=1 Tax=Corynebacterium sphenisci TaxID=191493 RepID=UPI0026E10750|nr:biotin--[acetyl-CoA-carboxylase] ligase [Corynebacterium sphenisci]MDO5731134.1 biotin--[acetyl-CoA-carboxylase] ligase [Corynebacterium sphenisci]
MTARTPLDPAALRAGLPGREVHAPAATGSTNADALARAAAGAAGGTVVATAEQRAGRGRMNRAWVAPPGATIALSVLLRPIGVPPARLGLLPLVAGLAVRDALAGLGVAAELKWPNDVLVGGRKICGILVEAASLEPPALVVGIGVNVDLAEAELPVPHATSLRLLGHREVDREALAAAIVAALDARVARWGADAAALLADYRGACATIGRRVRAELPDGSAIAGTATAVLGDGELEIRGADGARHALTAGDVTHLRGAGGYGGR